MNWDNLYADSDGEWYKGNLHMHTYPASDCATMLAQECVDLYIDRGYDFLSISDHMVYTDFTDDRLAFIPGTEWGSTIGEHTGIHCLDASVVEKSSKNIRS